MRGIILKPIGPAGARLWVASTKKPPTLAGVDNGLASGGRRIDAGGRSRRGAARQRRFQSDGQSTPSSRTRSRSVESESPTTVDGSPSTRRMNGPAEAVDRERARDEQRLAGGDVGVDLGVVERREAHGRDIRAPDRAAHRAAAVVDEPVARPEVAVAAVLREPARARDLGPVRLAVDRAAGEERGVAAEDEPVDRLAVVRAPDDRLGLRPARAAAPCRMPRAGPARPPSAATTASSSTPGAIGDRLDAGGAEGLQPGGRRGGEVQAHAPILPVRARAVECSEHG